jgi:hypothetical protein
MDCARAGSPKKQIVHFVQDDNMVCLKVMLPFDPVRIDAR